MYLLSIFQILIVFCLAANANIPSEYRVQKEIKLSSSSDLVIIIQLLMDNHINQKTEYEAIPENARNGMVRLLGTNGIEAFRKQLEVPKGDIELLKGKLEGKTFLFITEDKSIEFGSYNGPISVLYSVDANKLTKVFVTDETTQKQGSMELMRSLKTNWKVKEKGLNGYPEVFQVSCRPDFSQVKDEIKFKVNYSHFLFDGTHWKRKQRQVNGFWEDEGSFPGEYFFPKFK